MPTFPLETTVANMTVPDEPSSSANIAFEYPGADLILRSCDFHTFFVPKLYVINSSPKLANLIHNTLNSCDVVHDERLHLKLQLSDAGAILHSLLTFIFPVSPVLPSTVEEIMELLYVAQKYEMHSTMAHIRGSIARQDSPFIDSENAFHVYSLAQNYGLRQEALQAARATLTLSMTIEALEDKFDVMSGAALHELWKYHERVRSILISDLAEFKNGARGILTGLRCARSSHSLIPRWLDRYIDSIGRTPHFFDIAEFDIILLRHIRDKTKGGCTCSAITSQTIRTLWTSLTVTANGSIKKVDITT
jgi:hypothetical protein